MRKEQTTLHLQGKTIYIVTAKGGWSLIIMPDKIILDNYHNKGGHIHPEPKEHKKEIKIKHDTQNENLNVLINHIKENNELMIKELIEELK
ncbi:hypothetical protein [Methanobrevibacter curvatus]|uniref:Uncharacterized protein n=1 Tax=Methanobrevibacter curvatus TaxID=49547 RepID=A0A162FM53_9EURY|nr:hypothetical protein [Methanobrevibacter curvatus]KZX12050.1 hypothetical protein MBCUR_12020 [Methanobrevibacter curvatus]